MAEKIEYTDADGQSMTEKLNAFAETLSEGEFAALVSALKLEEDVQGYYYFNRNRTVGTVTKQYMFATPISTEVANLQPGASLAGRSTYRNGIFNWVTTSR